MIPITIEKLTGYSYTGYIHREDLTSEQLKKLGDTGSSHFNVDGSYTVTGDPSEYCEVYVDCVYVVNGKLEVPITDQEADYDDLAQQVFDLANIDHWIQDYEGQQVDAVYDRMRDDGL